jgi:hypothetical protein
MTANDLNADFIAKICFDFYDKNLITKSKPKENEWTNLAAILMKGSFKIIVKLFSYFNFLLNGLNSA